MRLLLVWTLALAAAPSRSDEVAPAAVPGPLEGMEFVTVPGGVFVMGDADHEVSDWSIPAHEVSVAAFEIMTTEVTQSMWTDLMGSNPSWAAGTDLPVESVAWEQCVEFTEKLDELDPGHDYRLPTEAEWEYACRAGTTTTYYWGDEFDAGCCWYYGNSPDATQPVGTTLPNALGLHDMSGNVWEWCEDWFHANYEGAPTDGSSWGEEPWGWDRVIRGGSYGCGSGETCRSAVRSFHAADGADFDIGFRVARTPR